MGSGTSKAARRAEDKAVVSATAEVPQASGSSRVPPLAADAAGNASARKGPQPLSQLSMGGHNALIEDLKTSMGRTGGLNREDVRGLLRKHGMELKDKELDSVFAACDHNGDGTITAEEFEQQLQLMNPAGSVASYFEKMLLSAGVVQTLARALTQRAAAVDKNDPIDAVMSKFSPGHFVEVLETSQDELVHALGKHCDSLRAQRASEAAAVDVNGKFAPDDGTFEGAYGGMTDFLAGIDAIGLPQPRVLEGMHAEFNDSGDSDVEWTTSNYGGIVTHPRLEWEYVVCPDMTKIYPGGRIPTKIETFLYAVAAEGYESMEAVTDPGERAEVEVAVLRRCKAQLDEEFLSKVLGRKVGKAYVQDLIGRLDQALAEDASAGQGLRLQDAVAKSKGVMRVAGGSSTQLPRATPWFHQLVMMRITV